MFAKSFVKLKLCKIKMFSQMATSGAHFTRLNSVTYWPEDGLR